MRNQKNQLMAYTFFTFLGAAIGGLLALKATDAIPKMMRRTMCAMMSNMVAQEGSEALTPEEM